MGVEREACQTEILAEDEPRYLRRQKPLEIGRRKFGVRWRLYWRVLAGGWLLYVAWDFVLYSPLVALADLNQVEVSGNHFIGRNAVLDKFARDQGRSVLRVPLDQRRRTIEQMGWVEHASVQRVLPNRIRVQLVERVPVAFLRLGTGLALVDAQGVILERPLKADFRFPVVTGFAATMPREQRMQRMQLYVQFLKDIELIRPQATEWVSEVDLTDGKDLRALLAGVPGFGFASAAGESPVLVHFGDGDFVHKFRIFVENIGHWRATVGRVESVDLRFARQAVVNPERKLTVAQSSARPTVRRAKATKARRAPRPTRRAAASRLR